MIFFSGSSGLLQGFFISSYDLLPGIFRTSSCRLLCFGRTSAGLVRNFLSNFFRHFSWSSCDLLSESFWASSCLILWFFRASAGIRQSYFQTSYRLLASFFQISHMLLQVVFMPYDSILPVFSRDISRIQNGFFRLRTCFFPDYSEFLMDFIRASLRFSIASSCNHYDFYRVSVGLLRAFNWFIMAL